MSRRLKECDPAEDIKEAFQVFDKSGTGVPVKELRHIMKSIGTLSMHHFSGHLLLLLSLPLQARKSLTLNLMNY
jgi:hypothetical protein